MTDEQPRHPAGGIGSGIGLTALAAAAARAVESSRRDRLIDDPYGDAFVRAAAVPLPLPVRWPAPDAELSPQEALLLLGAKYVGLRSRFFDDFLCDAGAAGVRQVVILAAGLDARAYRLDWPPSTHVFEIDQPAVLAFKDGVLRVVDERPRCARRTVPVDLRDDWPQALRDNGFDPAVRTVWVGEGVLPHLSADDEQRLLAGVDELSVVGSRVAVERSVSLAAPDGAGLRRAREVGQRAGIPLDQLIHADPRPDLAAWLNAHGWTVTDEPVHAVADRYRRNLADPYLVSRVGTAGTGAGAPTAWYTVASKVSAGR